MDFEHCDHLDDDLQGAPHYPIFLYLGEKRKLVLCLACGKAFQADILKEIMQDALVEKLGGRINKKSELYRG